MKVYSTHRKPRKHPRATHCQKCSWKKHASKFSFQWAAKSINRKEIKHLVHNPALSHSSLNISGYTASGSRVSLKKNDLHTLNVTLTLESLWTGTGIRRLAGCIGYYSRCTSSLGYFHNDAFSDKGHITFLNFKEKNPSCAVECRDINVHSTCCGFPIRENGTDKDNLNPMMLTSSRTKAQAKI